MKYPLILPKSRFASDKSHSITEEFNHIQIYCSDFNNSKQLGAYYLDMREAFAQHDKGIFDDFDSHGASMISWVKNARYSAVNIAQYGFIIHDICLENQAQVYLDVLQTCFNILIEMEAIEGNKICWSENYQLERYHLKENWISAMSLGACLSFYLNHF